MWTRNFLELCNDIYECQSWLHSLTSLHFYFTLSLNLNLMPQFDQKDNWHFRENGIHSTEEQKTKQNFFAEDHKNKTDQRKKNMRKLFVMKIFLFVKKDFSNFFSFRLSYSVKWHSTNTTLTHESKYLTWVCYTTVIKWKRILRKRRQRRLLLL